MSKLRFLLSKLASHLWVRPTLYSLAAIAWVLLGSLAEYFLPGSWRLDISHDTLVQLFTILASTMLTVATFSVSAIASAYASVASSATPRATKIVMGDSGVQSTLAAFLATFIYAVVSLTSLSAVEFKASGRLVLFIGFVVLVAWVLISFLRWVDLVTRLGRLDDTLQRVAVEARKVFANPTGILLGGRSQGDSTRPQDGHELKFGSFGYVQHIDMEELQEIAAELEGEIWLDIRPGKFAEKDECFGVLRCAGDPREEHYDRIDRAIAIGADRSFNTDSRFALILLSEIADRALSPAVNDPGTAIRVLALETELFHIWVKAERDHAENYDPDYDRIYVPRITAQDLVHDAFSPIARDGAASVEIGIRLQKTLRSLQRLEHHDLQAAAKAYSEVALEIFDQGLVAKSQREAVRRVAHEPI